MFVETLSVCAANPAVLDKMISITCSTLRGVLTTWVTFGIGLETFQLHGICEMTVCRCDSHWKAFFQDLINFYNRALGDMPPRVFNSELQDALAATQPRNEATLTALFWSDTGSDFPKSPIQGEKRNTKIAKLATTDEHMNLAEGDKMAQANVAYNTALMPDIKPMMQAKIMGEILSASRSAPMVPLAEF